MLDICTMKLLELSKPINGRHHEPPIAYIYQLKEEKHESHLLLKDI